MQKNNFIVRTISCHQNKYIYINILLYFLFNIRNNSFYLKFFTNYKLRIYKLNTQSIRIIR